jgi:hypothetical protein
MGGQLMRDIRAGAEVAGMIGAENMHRLRDGPEYGPFTCWHCHGRADPNTEPATVIAELGPGDAYTVIAQSHEGAARIALAHAECSRSQIVRTDTPAAVTHGTGGETATLTSELSSPDGRMSLLMRRPAAQNDRARHSRIRAPPCRRGPDPGNHSQRTVGSGKTDNHEPSRGRTSRRTGRMPGSSPPEWVTGIGS